MPNLKNPESRSEHMASQEKIVFFDGVCNLCNSSVSLLLSLDHHHRLKFSSLQSEVASILLPSEWTQTSRDYESIVFWKNGQIFSRSSALFEIAKELGWPWKALSLFGFFPKRLMDFFYRLIARNRYSLFGKKDTCRLIGADEKHLFLEHRSDLES